MKWVVTKTYKTLKLKLQPSTLLQQSSIINHDRNFQQSSLNANTYFMTWIQVNCYMHVNINVL